MYNTHAHMHTQNAHIHTYHTYICIKYKFLYEHPCAHNASERSINSRHLTPTHKYSCIHIHMYIYISKYAYAQQRLSLVNRNGGWSGWAEWRRVPPGVLLSTLFQRAAKANVETFCAHTIFVFGMHPFLFPFIFIYLCLYSLLNGLLIPSICLQVLVYQKLRGRCECLMSAATDSGSKKYIKKSIHT